MSLISDVLQTETPKLKWWGEHHFELHRPKAWQFGSLLFRLTRGLQEWRLEYHRPTVQYDYEQQWHRIDDPEFAFPPPVHIERYMFKNTHKKCLNMGGKSHLRTCIILSDKPFTKCQKAIYELEYVKKRTKKRIIYR